MRILGAMVIYSWLSQDGESSSSLTASERVIKAIGRLTGFYSDTQVIRRNAKTVYDAIITQVCM